LDGGGNECVAEAIGSQIAFVEIEILVEGQPGPPQTLNDFFGPVPGQVTLVTGPDPDRHATDVAMVLAAGVTNRYGAAATRIGVQEGDATPAGVFDRVVRIAPDTDGLALAQDDPRILLVGEGSTPDQLGLLFNELSVLASVASTTVLELHQVDQLDRTSLSLADLGVSELQTKGPGVNDVTFPISQTALGGPTGPPAVESARTKGLWSPVGTAAGASRQ
jgi:hypothetical protein